MNGLANAVKSILLDREESVAIAESVTAGDIQSAFSYCENALRIFEGGLTVYNVPQKIRLLHVDAEYATACEGVSEKTAAEMAIGVSQLFQSDWGISITGYASPVPETNIMQVFAWTALAHRGVVMLVQKIIPEPASVNIVRKFYTDKVFEIFLNVLRS
jgi:nicotinamide-nucleotide amidase